MKYVFYKILHVLVRFSLPIYFNKIEIIGEEYIKGSDHPKATIFAPNHQGAFLDALILHGIYDHPIYSVTRASVFRQPFLWFLEALHLLPVYRIRDGYSQISKNNAVFERCKEILLEDNALLVFPEAAHHKEHYLHPLSKGLVRIALDTQADTDKEITIIPTGINYFRHFYPRHKLILKYGKPLSVKPYMDIYPENRSLALNTLRTDLAAAIKQCLVIPDEDSRYEEQKEVFSRRNESLDFNSLRERAQDFPILKEQHFHVLRFIALVLSIPNVLFFAFTSYILNNKVQEVEFYGSLKFAFGLLVFPVFVLVQVLLLLCFVSWKVVVLFVAVKYLALLLRQQLLRYTH